jgi:hypothetical protein
LRLIALPIRFQPGQKHIQADHEGGARGPRGTPWRRRILATMPLGSVGYENAGNENGERYIWLEPNAVNRLRALRDPGENYSDVILRLAGRAALRSKLGRVIRR